MSIKEDIMRLIRQRGRSAGDLVRELDISVGTATKSLSELRALGLIECTYSLGNGASRKVWRPVKVAPEPATRPPFPRSIARHKRSSSGSGVITPRPYAYGYKW